MSPGGWRTTGWPRSELAPDGALVDYERHRPEQTALYRQVQPHAAGVVAHTEASTGAELPRFIKAEPGHEQSSGLFVPGEGPGHGPGAACKAGLGAFLDCGIPACMSGRAFRGGFDDLSRRHMGAHDGIAGG